MNRLIASLACLFVFACYGCSKNPDTASGSENKPTPAPKVVDKDPMPTEAPTPAPDLAHDGRTPDQHIADARARLGSQLVLVKKHVWGRQVSPQEMSAAEMVFATQGHQAGVNFFDMTDVQVKSLVGNPVRKTTQNGATIWTYVYENAGKTCGKHLRFQNNKVVEAFWQ